MHSQVVVGSVPAARRPGAVRIGAVLAGAVLLAALALVLARVGLSSWQALRDGEAALPDDVVVLAAATVGSLVAAWLAAGALVVLSTVLCGGARSRLVPMTVHAVVATVLGLAMAPAASASDATSSVGVLPAPTSTSAALHAGATIDPGWGALSATESSSESAFESSSPTATASTNAQASATVDPGWLPAAPTPPPRVAPPVDSVVLGSLRASVTPQEEIVVRRGDTLWDLAARHLGPNAGDAEIAAAWPQWHEANRATIGDDPDLLLPGQLLRPPR